VTLGCLPDKWSLKSSLEKREDLRQFDYQMNDKTVHFLSALWLLKIRERGQSLSNERDFQLKSWETRRVDRWEGTGCDAFNEG
jgi:hypothetical protein